MSKPAKVSWRTAGVACVPDRPVASCCRERSRSAEISRSRERERERNLERDAVTTGLLNGHRGVANGASVREMRELGGSTPPSPSASPSPDEQSSPAAPQQRDRYHTDARKALDRKLRSARPKRFTFQSTLRQIERRRIAEKLSRDAELKGIGYCSCTAHQPVSVWTYGL